VQRTVLGRTGLEVGVAGLGCGGHSRLGMARGRSEDEAADVVRAALDRGVDFIDTAAAYGTEGAVGKALRGRRDAAVISTKVQIADEAAADGVIDAGELGRRVDGCLARLGTDVVDILHLHGVTAEQYPACVERLVPAMAELRRAGKVRFLGITERFIPDPGHAMFARALDDDWIDVLMVGANVLNFSAAERVLPQAAARRIGTLAMFAVRGKLADPGEVRALVADLVARGKVDARSVDAEDPLGFLVGEGAAASVVEACYRFVRHLTGMDVVLFGTGDTGHLEANIRAIQGPPLPPAAIERLQRAFGRVDDISAN